jgi:predicted membrane protein
MSDELDPKPQADATPPQPALDKPSTPGLMDRVRPHTFTPKLVFGIAIIVAGLLLTLDNLIPDHDIFRIAFKFWPVILIVMGYAKIRSEQEQNVGGYVLVAAGIFGLLVTFGFHRFGDFIWPAMLLTAGIFIVTKALKQHRSVPPELQSSAAFVACSAIFSGCKRRPLGLFKGGELTAIFGGFEIDLRKAELEAGTARIDVFVLFGGGEIQVPEGWEVQNQATAIFGGVNDKTQTHALSTETPKVLLTGLVLFGGVELKN